MFGFTKDNIINMNINILIPSFLVKRHRQAISLALNNTGLNIIKKNVMLLGVHSSGYLIPFKITVGRDINFSDVPQFYATFIQIPYSNPTLSLLTNEEGTIKGATSGNIFFNIEIFSWFGIDSNIIMSNNIKLYDLVTELEDIKIPELVKDKKKISFNFEKYNKNKRNILSKNDLNFVTDLFNKEDITMEINVTVPDIGIHKDIYIVQLIVTKEKLDICQVSNPSVKTVFAYDRKYNAYMRYGKNERETITREDSKDKSTFHKKGDSVDFNVMC